MSMFSRGPGRFRPPSLGANQPKPARVCSNCRRQRAGTLETRTIEREFAENRVAGENILRHETHGGEKTQRQSADRMAAFLRQIGGREVDGYALGRQGQTASGQGGADPLAAFRHGLVGKTYEGEGHDAGSNLHLHIDRQGLEFHESYR